MAEHPVTLSEYSNITHSSQDCKYWRHSYTTVDHLITMTICVISFQFKLLIHMQYVHVAVKRPFITT